MTYQNCSPSQRSGDDRFLTCSAIRFLLSCASPFSGQRNLLANMNARTSFLGGILAFTLATSCCWLPALTVFLGGAAGVLSLNEQMASLSGPLMVLAAGFISYGLYRKWRPLRAEASPDHFTPDSLITCPYCGHRKMETMPVNACQYFYACTRCQKVLKPKEGDCCVFCSYGTEKCPPIQLNQNCC